MRSLRKFVEKVQVLIKSLLYFDALDHVSMLLCPSCGLCFLQYLQASDICIVIT